MAGADRRRGGRRAHPSAKEAAAAQRSFLEELVRDVVPDEQADRIIQAFAEKLANPEGELNIMSTWLQSVVRTVVPGAWAAFELWLASLALLGEVSVWLASENVVVKVTEIAALAVVNGFVRWVEPHLPDWLTRLLLGSAKAPTYSTRPLGLHPFSGVDKAPLLLATTSPGGRVEQRRLFAMARSCGCWSRRRRRWLAHRV